MLPGCTCWPGSTRMGGRWGIVWAAVARSVVMLSFSRGKRCPGSQDARHPGRRLAGVCAETRRDTRNVRRSTHDPQVAGSKPAPATRKTAPGAIAPGAVFVAMLIQRMGTHRGRAAGSSRSAPPAQSAVCDRVPGRCFCRSGPPSLAADDAFWQDAQDRVSCGCPMILAASVRARRGGETNAWI